MRTKKQATKGIKAKPTKKEPAVGTLIPADGPRMYHGQPWRLQVLADGFKDQNGKVWRCALSGIARAITNQSVSGMVFFRLAKRKETGPRAARAPRVDFGAVKLALELLPKHELARVVDVAKAISSEDPVQLSSAIGALARARQLLADASRALVPAMKALGAKRNKLETQLIASASEAA